MRLDIYVPTELKGMCERPNYMTWEGRYHHSGRPKFSFHPFKEGLYQQLVERGVPFIEVPCGKCLSCRIQYSSLWADRCVLEAKNSNHNYFVTLTYDDVHMPNKGSLDPEDFRKFIHNLRLKFNRKGINGIRFFGCGEYSPDLRPHYHILLFNCPLDDLTSVFEMEVDGKMELHVRVGDNLYYSRTIYDSWGRKGIISCGQVNFFTAQYVANYVTKKIDKDYQEKLGDLHPEFLRMSTNPGIGGSKFDENLYDHEHMIIPKDGQAKMSPIPRYYDKLFCKKYGDDVFDCDIRIGRLKKRLKRVQDEPTALHDDILKYRAAKIAKTHSIEARSKV